VTVITYSSITENFSIKNSLPLHSFTMRCSAVYEYSNAGEVE